MTESEKVNQFEDKIAKLNRYESFENLLKNVPSNLQRAYQRDVMLLILSSKDKEIQDSLKLYENQNQTIINQSKEITELKEKVKFWEADRNTMAEHRNEYKNKFGKAQSEVNRQTKYIESLQSDLSRLKEYVEVMHKTEEGYRSEVSRVSAMYKVLQDFSNKQSDKIQSLQEEIKGFKKTHEIVSERCEKLREEMKKKEWKEVKDIKTPLPEENRRVILFCPQRDYSNSPLIIIGSYNKIGDYFESPSASEDESLFPTHWQPLPEPPKI